MLVVLGKSTFILEQPVSSLFTQWPRWRWAVRCLRSKKLAVYKQHIYLGKFGAESSKPLHLWSNNKNLLHHLRGQQEQLPPFASASRRLVKHSISKTGKRQVTGQRQALRASQWEPQFKASWPPLACVVSCCCLLDEVFLFESDRIINIPGHILLPTDKLLQMGMNPCH